MTRPPRLRLLPDFSLAIAQDLSRSRQQVELRVMVANTAFEVEDPSPPIPQLPNWARNSHRKLADSFSAFAFASRRDRPILGRWRRSAPQVEVAGQAREHGVRSRRSVVQYREELIVIIVLLREGVGQP